MRDLSAGPRVLLKRLREMMAEHLEPQDRLDQIVRQIAGNMVAEVCSVYVLRSDSVLELYATEGLNKDAVHLAQLKMGQGLVGTIAASAQPLNLSDAQAPLNTSASCFYLKPVRKFIIPSSACRFCAPVALLAFLWSRTRPAEHTGRMKLKRSRQPRCLSLK